MNRVYIVMLFVLAFNICSFCIIASYIDDLREQIKFFKQRIEHAYSKLHWIERKFDISYDEED